jgi:hypothetical protein
LRASVPIRCGDVAQARGGAERKRLALGMGQVLLDIAHC